MSPSDLDRHLQSAEETDVVRVYVYGIDELDFLAHINCLSDLGYDVVNINEIRDLDDIGLRDHVRGLCGADALAIPDLWWTELNGNLLMQIAGWMAMPILNEKGAVLGAVGRTL